ncbi:hypothetical protein BC829DRAFT_167886 [Chytridium lagenaria]|nr:hypothetical protein BC829DRAFT_167886 [Chytridium lagenaria]
MDVRPLRLRLTSSESAAPTPSSPSPVTEDIPIGNDASAIISMIADTPSHDSTPSITITYTVESTKPTPEPLSFTPTETDRSTIVPDVSPIAPAAESTFPDLFTDEPAPEDLSASLLLSIPVSSTSQELPTPTQPLIPTDIPLPLFSSTQSSPRSFSVVEEGLVSLPVSRRSSISPGETSDSDGETRLEDSMVVLGRRDLAASGIMFKANQ